jgi:hypothetical protein
LVRMMMPEMNKLAMIMTVKLTILKRIEEMD